MLVDTHCHITAMIKNSFDVPLEKSDIDQARLIIKEADNAHVSLIVEIGGEHKVENANCILLAQTFKTIFATVGIHPNRCSTWQEDLALIKTWIANKETNKIVGIGECGLDMHYLGYNLKQQKNAFKAQIELALEHDLALVVHSRDAYDETLYILEEYKNNIQNAVMHCFAYDQSFAQTVTDWNFMLGIGGTVTYPKNNELRNVVKNSDLKNIVFETDAPFLPPQTMRGKQNHPQNIATIAQYVAELRNENFATIAQQTTHNALKLFNLHDILPSM
jgi:TatD DNase family protein